jgi:hypothetical protein
VHRRGNGSQVNQAWNGSIFFNQQLFNQDPFEAGISNGGANGDLDHWYSSSSDNFDFDSSCLATSHDLQESLQQENGFLSTGGPCNTILETTQRTLGLGSAGRSVSQPAESWEKVESNHVRGA